MAESGLPPFDQVYAEYRDRIYRFCLSQLRDPTKAEDVAAEVFASAFAAYSRFTLKSEAITPWLFRIARNAIIDQHRSSVRFTQLLTNIGRGQSGSSDVETTAANRDELRRALEAIAQLRGRDRMLIGLRVAAGLPYAEIGRILGMSEAAAGVATQRALDRVRRIAEELP